MENKKLDQSVEEANIEKLAINHYGDHQHLYAQQRDGFIVGYLAAKNVYQKILEIVGVPKFIIDNPELLNSTKPTDKDIAWAKDKIASWQAQQAVPVGALQWVKVKDRPLYVSTPLGWECTKDGEGEFLAAVEVEVKGKDKNEWWIKHCVVEDQVGLCIVGEMDNEPAGWDLSDVEYYIPIPKPPNKILEEATVPKKEEGWLTEKPVFDRDCILLTAFKISEKWEYSSWRIEWLNFNEGGYWGWLNMDGEEYGDIADLTADRYKIIELPTTHVKEEDNHDEFGMFGQSRRY